jgi:CRP-like cAMP-binding protein
MRVAAFPSVSSHPRMKTSGNLLIDVCSPKVLGALGAEVVSYDVRHVLVRAEEVPQAIFFPHRGALVSVVRSTASGAMVEAGVVGYEGAVPVEALLAEPVATENHIIMQGTGDLTAIPTKAAREFFASEPAFRDRVLAFTTNYLHQITQTAVCNRKHEIEPRLARWLLGVRDRIERDELNLTQEFLSHMLGIHRPGVAIALNSLEIDGLVTHARNRIVISDRIGLLARACECYETVSRRLEQLRQILTT